MAKVHAAETRGHGEGGAFESADEVAGYIAAAALQGDEKDIVDVAIYFVAQAN